jgi:general secretion pathway protein G
VLGWAAVGLGILFVLAAGTLTFVPPSELLALGLGTLFIGAGVASRFLRSRTQGTILVCVVLAISATSTVLVERWSARRIRHDRTRLEISTLEEALRLYHTRTGRYPDKAAGLRALIDLEIIEREPHDAWGNPYRYELIDEHPVITSFGADGLRGGEGINADISNRSSELSAR